MKTNWLDERIAMSDFLSDKKNWTPTMIVIARESLILGIILGLVEGLGLGIMYCIYLLMQLVQH